MRGTTRPVIEEMKDQMRDDKTQGEDRETTMLDKKSGHFSGRTYSPNERIRIKEQI